MSLQYHSIEKILADANPQQKIMWNEIFLRFGERIAVVPLYYVGVGAGEFANYIPRKIYVAYQVEQSSQHMGAAAPNFQFFNENNVYFWNALNLAPVWNTTAAAINIFANQCEVQNIYFSRVAINTNQFRFIGFRITY